ncbi:acetoacetate--CoA ligase [Sinorhizobium meliloti]|uniref:acetoacetate--CoA ligase n=1 Tax=Rhizobium meliloti TaxID=382 RepID=UPI001297366D|nr:acetoacetate--CoA ligase [Sinorhizobium meliloti]MDW9610878.1 acetoacetate--CoA ligase [Sinorhizobium meliloti]MDW9835930.1 acetoacetate--CoA ligase [Sinorhizobium meliloti]MDX0040381.1 acetoacetate--CoA ligase [Sinorhizobium meliloti]MDX0088903.1 acetoacetate--CoA ligase [Sinorhizobium meliloti]MQX63443.1 acetoacetate--CoA ligase [Sinorhizobium meliloti]
MTAIDPLWVPADPTATAMHAFMERCNDKFGVALESYADLHAWSVAERASFWSMVWDFCGVRGEKGAEVLVDEGDMFEARFFPDGVLNFAENLLAGERYPADDALVFRGEDKVSYRWTWAELRDWVSRLQQAFRAHGIREGDRIAAMLPNMPETVACMLAAASIGAVWASCSPDFGDKGVLDRFGQIEPKLFITCDGYWYNGKHQDLAAKIRSVASGLRAPVVVVDYTGKASEIVGSLNDGRTLLDMVAPFESTDVMFERLPFSHPLYILFSSGTTGVPKCIVHSAGGTLLQHLKEHRLHCDIQAGERIFYFTTCGWMMWNWLASGLAVGATLCLYDGSPFAPAGTVLFDYAQEERFAVFGTSAKYIDAVRKGCAAPRTTHELPYLRLIASTGSPLSSEGFKFVYEDIKRDVQLASISGGTDIVSCFVLGNPMTPVWEGEIQGPGLGLAVEVWDEEARPVTGAKGELVCTKAFPSMPLAFWNDPEDRKYRSAYFERFDGVWCHGDFAEWTQHGGIVIHGRSDATLNPGGVRIGTAEIYSQVEQLHEVAESLCIGQHWDNDIRVILFVLLRDGVDLTEELQAKIKAKIRMGASPRHVPTKIVQVSDIPRTKSGKIVELAVRDVVHGRPVANKEALANPEALDQFSAMVELSV